MPLVTAQGYQLTPDVIGNLSRGATAAQQYRLGEIGIQQQQAQMEAARQEAARQQKLQDLLGQIGPGGIVEQQPGLNVPQGATPPFVPQGQQSMQMGNEARRQQALARLAVQFPEQFDQVFSNIGAIDERSRNEASRAAFEISQAPPERRPGLIQRRADQIMARGGDPSDTLELLQMTPQQQDIALETLQMGALTPQQRMDVSRGTPLKTFAPVAMEGGGLAIPTADPRTGKVTAEVIPGAVSEKPLSDLDREKLDISRQQLDIDRMKADQAQQTNELRRRELQAKIDTAENKLETNQKKVEEKRRLSLEKIDIVVDKVDSALEKTGFFTTGFTGATLAQVPGTEAFDLNKTIDTIKANLGFTALQQMRDASPTGGALGQIAVQELNMLQSTLESLDPRQSEDVLRENLENVKRHFQNWRSVVTESNRQENTVGRFHVEVVE